MASTTDAARPRAFDPASRAGAPVPPAPGWDVGPDRRIDRGGGVVAKTARAVERGVDEWGLERVAMTAGAVVVGALVLRRLLSR